LGVGLGKLWFRYWSQTAGSQYVGKNIEFDSRSWKFVYRPDVTITFKLGTLILAYGIQQCAVTLTTLLAKWNAAVNIRNIIVTTIIAVDVRDVDVVTSVTNADDGFATVKLSNVGDVLINAATDEANGGYDAHATYAAISTISAAGSIGKAVRSKERQVSRYFWFDGEQTC
jgi:hypothetical protein